MKTVYITKANLNRIISNLKSTVTFSIDSVVNEIEKDLQQYNLFHEDHITDFFNNNELKNIILYKKVLSSEFETIINNIKQNKQNINYDIANSNKKYLFKTDRPAYHSDSTCHYLNSDFNNIRLPEQYNNDNVKKNLQKYIHLPFNHINNIFQKLYNTNEQLTEIHYDNTGSTTFINSKVKDLIVIEQKAIKYKKQLRFLLSNENIGKKIANFRYAPTSKLALVIQNEDVQTKKAIIEFHEAKIKLKEIIYNLYNIKNNQLEDKFHFNQYVLDEIGFKACRGCSAFNRYDLKQSA